MELICKGHNTCEYRDVCPHGKLHEIKKHGIDQTEDCTLLHESETYINMPKKCFCDITYTRKFKLNKLKNKNYEKLSEEN